MISERKVVNNKKFPHIFNTLDGLDATLDGEIYIPFKTVIDLARKSNWDKARFVVWDILELRGKDLRNLPLKERQKILVDTIERINHEIICGIVHIPIEFEDVDVAWDYVTHNKLEGIILKDLNSTYSFKDIFEVDRRKSWIKVKFWKEGKEKIIGFDKGSLKGAFRLENGSKISSLKPELEQRWRTVKDLRDIYAEFQYLNETDTGSYFQPILKRLVDNKGKVIWE